jgi:DNA-binding NarL/FixJ family response regulator
MLEAIVNRLEADDGVRVVATVGDGRALVDTYATLHAAGEAPDVVLCDYSMPGLNGLEALRAILDRHPQARVLILSASPSGCRARPRRRSSRTPMSRVATPSWAKERSNRPEAS